MIDRFDTYDPEAIPESTFSSTEAEELIPYILWCHRDASHHLSFTGDAQLQSAEIADVVLEKIRSLKGGHVSDLRNAVREALNHLLMTHPLISQYCK